MAILNLTKVWVNRLDTGEAVAAQSGIDRTQVHSVDGEVSTWAGGRQRASISDGDRGQFGATLRLVSLATVATLRLWRGIPVQVRDARGQRFFGTYFQVNVSESREVAYYNVDFTLVLLTVVEGV